MGREAIDEAIGYECSSRDTCPHIRTPNESLVKWTCRRKGSSIVEATVEATYWIAARAEAARQFGCEPGDVECVEEKSETLPAAHGQLNGSPAAITGEDFYDGDTGTISIF